MGEEGSDADSNLLEAFKVAVSDICGISLVFNGKVIKGTRAFKIHSLNQNAFVSCNYPYLGMFKDGKLVINKASLSDDNYNKKVTFYNNICKMVPIEWTLRKKCLPYRSFLCIILMIWRFI